MSPPLHLALLRGINVGGRNRLPMAELRALGGALGWMGVQSYIQSGNLVFRSPEAPEDLERALEEAIAERFGLAVPVLVREAADWPATVRANPFAEASERAPNLVMLALSKAPPPPGAAEALQARAAHGERVEQAGEALWIHFAGGVARSKLTPALLDRLVGSPVTLRNWRTVLKLAEMIEQA